ncbi:MAG: hypothetical protein ACJ8HQ_09745 [Chthoniobacterales bacterium]
MLRRLIFLASCVLSLTAAARADLTLEEIVARNTEAMGGRAAIEAVQAVEVALHIKDPGFEVDGVYYAARPGRMRIDIMADGKRVYMERFDGEKGWDWNGKEEKEEGATPTAALRHGIELPGNLFGLHEVQTRGHQLELTGREKIDGVEFYVLRMTFADRDETRFLIDPATWRITRRRDVRALHPDVDPTKTTIESRKSDWRQVDGVWFAFASEDVDLKTGKVLESTRLKEIKLNPPIDASIFTKL